MAKDKRKSKMALRKKSSARPTTMNDIPGKLLELILLHLTSPVCIIHAAAVCRKWRRIITSTPFLGRLHQRHPHPVAGHYHPQPPSGSNRIPLFVPSPQEISVDRHHFSLDFLPAGGGRSWKIVDSRSSLLLLARRKGGWMRHCFPDLVVCEPLTHFYRLVPRPPEMKHHECLGVFLKVYGNYYMPEPDFCVTCVLYESYTGVSGDVGTVRVCVFSKGRRGIRRWRIGGSSGIAGLNLSVQGKDTLQFVGCAVDASFWWVRDENKPQRQRLICACSHVSLFVLPEHVSRLCVDASAFRVVDGSDHKVRIACLEGAYLKVFSRSYWNDGNNEDWMLEKQVNLVMAAYGFPRRKECLGNNIAVNIVMASGRCVMLGTKESERSLMISIELETMRAERTRIGSKRPSAAYPYQLPSAAYPYQLPWPPRFHACLYQCKWRGKGPCYQNCTC
ncbi:unnamed protein product [Urochloa humidicola]